MHTVHTVSAHSECTQVGSSGRSVGAGRAASGAPPLVWYTLHANADKCLKCTDSDPLSHAQFGTNNSISTQFQCGSYCYTALNVPSNTFSLTFNNQILSVILKYKVCHISAVLHTLTVLESVEQLHRM